MRKRFFLLTLLVTHLVFAQAQGMLRVFVRLAFRESAIVVEREAGGQIFKQLVPKGTALTYQTFLDRRGSNSYNSYKDISKDFKELKSYDDFWDLQLRDDYKDHQKIRNVFPNNCTETFTEYKERKKSDTKYNINTDNVCEVETFRGKKETNESLQNDPPKPITNNNSKVNKKSIRTKPLFTKNINNFSVITLIPNSKEEFVNIFGRAPTPNELNSITRIQKSSSFVVEKNLKKAKNILLLSNYLKSNKDYFVIIGHNENGNLILSSGEKININLLDSLKGAKNVLILSCEAQLYTSLASPLYKLTYQEAFKIANQLNTLNSMSKKMNDSLWTANTKIVIEKFNATKKHAFPLQLAKIGAGITGSLYLIDFFIKLLTNQKIYNLKTPSVTGLRAVHSLLLISATQNYLKPTYSAIQFVDKNRKFNTTQPKPSNIYKAC